MKQRQLLVALVLMIGSLGGRGAEALADPFDGIRQDIQQRLVDDQIPSLAVAVARDGEIVWQEGFGWADREERRPADEHTMYSLASISKPITATGLMVLVERGLVDLDSPANEYLGDARLHACIGDVREATLRRLANQTSGLPLHYQFFYADEPYARPPMDESIRRYGRLVNPPGETYQYANFGYGVLDYIIARTAKMDYADFMRREVFLPLGMTRTSVDIGPGLEKHQAVRYAPDQTPLPFYTFDHPGASAVYGSAHDLARFGMFHLKQPLDGGKAILSDASIDEMHRPTGAIAGDSAYGIGWRIDTRSDGVRVVSHTGGMGGVSTRLTLIPERHLVVVALANSNTYLPHYVSQQIIATLLPEDARRRGDAEHTPTGDDEAVADEAMPALRGRWVGAVQTYESEVSVALQFMDSGDVHVQLGDQLKTLLSDVRIDGEHLRGRFAGDIGTPDANRRPYHLHLNLRRRGDALNGSITAISRPDNRAGNALSYWVEVCRQLAAEQGD